jgi:hypothetical protein
MPRENLPLGGFAWNRRLANNVCSDEYEQNVATAEHIPLPDPKSSPVKYDW